MVKRERETPVMNMHREKRSAEPESIEETSKQIAVAYAVARRSNAKDCAKVTGRPWSVAESLGASAGRALRAKRCCQERRQCARSARVKTSSVVVVTGDGADMVLKAKTTVSQRMTFNHSRRMRQRGQSRHRTGATGSGAGASVGVGEEEALEESGHNTALTRRGLIVVLLS